jgi:hypothetical protein
VLFVALLLDKLVEPLGPEEVVCRTCTAG